MPRRSHADRAVYVFAALLMAAAPARATEWFVAAGGTGGGTAAAPLGRIQDALTRAQAGDIVTVRPGTYAEALRSVRPGRHAEPILVRAASARGSVVVTSVGRVLTVEHPHIIIEGLVFDGQYGAGDTIRVTTPADGFTLRNVEVRRSAHDLVDIGGPSDVLIDGCLLHHALNAAEGRTDAHGIAAGPVQRLTVRDSEIHTFSGDGIQIDPGRSSPGWSNVLLEGLRIWLQPLPAAENGFAAGAVPGENAVDTKASAVLPRATLVIRNTTAWGFRHGLITNMAAFNLKEHISATLDGVTVYDSEIAFRVRGGGTTRAGAWATISNAVIHDVSTAYRYEDNIQNLRIWHNTIGARVQRAFQAASSPAGMGIDVRNLLALGRRPAEALDRSNLAVEQTAFVNVTGHDYRLASGSPAIDAGVSVSGTSIDRNGMKRPMGRAPDVGAYEWQPR